MWVSFDVANIWQKIDNSKSLKGKFRQKVDFFRGRDENWTSWCVLQLEVVCACRPSSRLFVEHSTFASTSTHIFDIRPLFGLLFVKALWPKAIWPTLRKGPIYVFFLSLFFLSLEVKVEGGLKGGCYTKGLREERRGGEKGWGVGEGVHTLQVEVFVPISMCFSMGL